MQPADAPRWRTPRQWRAEVLLPIAIALVTIASAMLTYLSINEESSAVDNDRLAVEQSVLVQSRQTGAQAQTHGFGSLATQYRAMLAEADAIEQTDPERAQLQRTLAQSFATKALIYGYLSGSAPQIRFDHDAFLAATLHGNDAIAIPENQPELTAAVADRQHARARGLAASVVVMLAVVVLLMLARLARPGRRRASLSVASAIGSAGALLLAIVNTV